VGRFFVTGHIISVEKSKKLKQMKKGGEDYEKAI